MPKRQRSKDKNSMDTEAGDQSEDMAKRGKMATKDAGDCSMAADDSSKERYTFFFGSDSPFSQWHPAKFQVDDITYNCAEQYMMHQKAVLFEDDAMAKRILDTKCPKTQKALGRKVSNFDEVVWKEKCRDIVRDASRAKFSQNEHLKEALLATEGTTMVEAAPRDRIWGIGLGASNPKALRKATWRGRNWLGYILTQVRDELKSEQAEKPSEK